MPRDCKPTLDTLMIARPSRSWIVRATSCSAGFVLAMAAVACGQAAERSDRASPISASPSVSTTTSSPQTPTSSSVSLPVSGPSPPSPPELRDPSTLLNRNRRDGGLGELCWARREVLLALHRDIETGIDVANLTVTPGTFDALQSAQRALAALGSDEIPSEASDFARHFQESLKRALTNGDATFNAVSSEFAFDDYPGAASYVSVARKWPGCPQP